MTFSLTSPAFATGAAIPRKYTCDGEDASPPLAWSGAPQGTRGFALVMDDPDAPGGTWDHWVLYGLRADAVALPEGAPAVPTLEGGVRQGKNSWGRVGYGGPCPPRGVHRYFFKLYALDVALDLAPGATKAQLLAAVRGHVLAEAELMGRYGR